LRKNGKHGRDRRTTSEGSSSSSDSSSSSSSSSSDDSSSSSDESDDRIATAMPASASKPLFVPKSKRGTVAEVEMRQKKLEEAEERRLEEAEKRAIRSRALVAEIASSAAGAPTNDGNEGDEFDTGEAGGEYIPVPDDADPDEGDHPELAAAERDAWEVRELIRILRDVDRAAEREKERGELERRRALTDEERLAEDRLSGRYRAPGEARRRRAGGGRMDGVEGGDDGAEGGGRYLQRFHHRGAFYMDEDTLDRAGPDDVRHRAAEYSRAATGEDKIDKTALPEVMQVKKFGFAGYSTKYKGLAREDTTDRKMEFLPIRGRGGESAGRGRGGGYGYGYNGGDGQGGGIDK
jgi:microfibrillar-associated protein 1